VDECEPLLRGGAREHAFGIQVEDAERLQRRRGMSLHFVHFSAHRKHILWDTLGA